MLATAKLLSEDEIAEMRQNDQHVWSNCNPTYMNMVDRLICDVSQDSIPEPLKGKILLRIRQIGRDLVPYNH